MKMSQAFPSKYLKAADLQDRNVKLVMNRVELEDVGGDDRKPVLYFEKAVKGLVLNKTNAKVIVSAYGDNTDGWEGKELILFPAMVDFRGDQVEAIRVKIPKNNAPPPPVHDEVSGHLDDDIPF